MKRDYRKWHSPVLGRDMELLVFGEGGTPVLVFPTSMGRFFQWEDFGMIAHLAPRIDAGWLQLWCVDSVDSESFYDKKKSPSGAYDAARWLGGSREGEAYYVNPLTFLPNLNDERYLEPLRATEIVIATGRDDPNAEESRRMAKVLQDKGVPASLHVWDGWSHDWPYWKEMVDVFL